MYYYTGMREFQEKRFWRRVFFSRLVFMLLAAILIFFGYSASKVYLKNRNVRKANELVQKEIEDLKTKKAELEASLRRLQSETGVEEEIRGKFPVKKPGEQAVIIVEEQNKNNLPASVSSSFFQKIWQFIKSIF